MAEVVRIAGAHAPNPGVALVSTSADHGVLLVSSGSDGVCRWNPDTGARLWRAAGTSDAALGFATVHADGVPVLAAATEQADIVRWDARTGEQLPGWGLCDSEFWGIDAAVLPGGRAIVVGAGEDGVFRIDALTGELVGDVLEPDTGALSVNCRTLDDGTVVIVCGNRGGQVQRIDALTGQLLGPPLQVQETDIPDIARVTTVDLPGGATLVVGTEFEGLVHRWDLRTGEPVGEPIDAGEPLPDVSALRLAGESVLITSGYEQVVRCWHAVTGELLASLPRVARSCCGAGPNNTILLASLTRAGDLALDRLGTAAGPGR
ncbi:WD40 repeat domain-containing protein [Kitasatospora sp. LaBMicrA B282]|uniref:WD40 repeat domain-containing protein n=1 Tax=Kitasatospora sp. LaBMicrA B282 TaxID=3420949 RepID=UPI003D0AEED3